MLVEFKHYVLDRLTADGPHVQVRTEHSWAPPPSTTPPLARATLRGPGGGAERRRGAGYSKKRDTIKRGTAKRDTAKRDIDTREYVQINAVTDPVWEGRRRVGVGKRV